MMDRRKIEEAAEKYAEEAYIYEEEIFARIASFQAGVKWAEQEFVKSLWHHASEEPKEFVCVITEAPWNNGLTHTFDWNCGNWEKNVKGRGYIKWCYLDDILPKRGANILIKELKRQTNENIRN